MVPRRHVLVEVAGRVADPTGIRRKIDARLPALMLPLLPDPILPIAGNGLEAGAELLDAIVRATGGAVHVPEVADVPRSRFDLQAPPHARREPGGL